MNMRYFVRLAEVLALLLAGQTLPLVAQTVPTDANATPDPVAPIDFLGIPVPRSTHRWGGVRLALGLAIPALILGSGLVIDFFPALGW